MAEVLYPIHDVILSRSTKGELNVNVPIIYHYHGKGIEWGYLGSGPADLSMNILAHFVGCKAAKEKMLYQDFKEDIIAKIPHEGGIITKSEIENWLADHGVSYNV